MTSRIDALLGIHPPLIQAPMAGGIVDAQGVAAAFARLTARLAAAIPKS